MMVCRNYSSSMISEELPAPFIPCRRQRLKPPLMYFGWKINADDWLEYAEQHDCTVMTRIMHSKYEHAPDHNVDDHEDRDEMVAVEEVDKLATALEVFWSFLRGLGIVPHSHFPLGCCMGVKWPRKMSYSTRQFPGEPESDSGEATKITGTDVSIRTAEMVPLKLLPLVISLVISSFLILGTCPYDRSYTLLFNVGLDFFRSHNGIASRPCLVSPHMASSVECLCRSLC